RQRSTLTPSQPPRCPSCPLLSCVPSLCFFFFNDTATPGIYTLSLHDALPIWCDARCAPCRRPERGAFDGCARRGSARVHACPAPDRKSTRLNSSHDQISYAVFCLKKKKMVTARPRRSIARRHSRTWARGGCAR